MVLPLSLYERGDFSFSMASHLLVRDELFMVDRVLKDFGPLKSGNVVFSVAGPTSALSLLCSVVDSFAGILYFHTIEEQDVYFVLRDKVPGFQYIVQFCGCVMAFSSENEPFC
jgi:hypothetical protein